MYVNHVLTLEIDVSYTEYLAMLASNQPTYHEESTLYTQSTTHICGSSLDHMFVDTTSEVINLTVKDITVGAIVGLLCIRLGIPTGASWIISTFTSIAQYCIGSKADYLKVTQNKYFVDDPDFSRCWNCYHTYVMLYSYRSDGSIDIYDSYWEQYQYYL